MSDTINRTPEATAPTTTTTPAPTTPAPTTPITPSAPPGEPERRTAVIAVTVALLFAVVLVVAGRVADGPGSEVPSQDEVTQQLINKGLVPSGATSEPSAAWHSWASQSGQIRGSQPPLYTPDELATMKLVQEGTLPASTLDTDRFVTKRLANQGLLPRAAAQ
jgi:hypothetical protein